MRPILALDPSTKRLGMALIVDGNPVWAVGFDLPKERWMREIFGFVSSFLDCEVIGQVVIEEPGPWTRPKERSSTKAVEQLAKARGAVILACEHAGVPWVEMPVNTARHIVCGKGNVKKWEAHELLALDPTVKMPLLPNGEVDEDAADAIIVGLAFYRQENLESRIVADTSRGRRSARVSK